MGKSGELLRARKRANKVYTFTQEQLEAHDKMIKELFLTTYKSKLEEERKIQEAKLKEEITKEWEERMKEFSTGDANDQMAAYLKYLLAVPVKVLIEMFKWKAPKPGYRLDGRLKIVKFADAVVDEIVTIGTDEMLDIRKYADDVYNKYGIKFNAGE